MNEKRLTSVVICERRSEHICYAYEAAAATTDMASPTKARETDTETECEVSRIERFVKYFCNSSC